MALALEKHPIRLLAFCLMPNHWHMVLWPEQDDQLTAFLRWLTHTHTQRWHAHHHTAGTGHLYQGRFKSFPIEQDDHLLTVLRYAERNPLRAGLVSRAERWRWSSLGHAYRQSPQASQWLHKGRWPDPQTGSHGSMRPKRRLNLRRCDAAWCVAAPLAQSCGKDARHDAWIWAIP